MLRLLQAGRAFSGLAAPLLYRHVRLSRPSVLRAFHQTLATQPELGLLVESLHIGEDEPLPDHWWPLRTTGSKEPDYDSEDDQSERWLDHFDHGTPEPKDPYRIFFRLNLGGEGRWRGCPFYEHELDAPNDLDAAHVALDRAFDAASRDLDVNLQRRDRNYAERKISVNTWHIRVLEVQATVELHYLDMLRRHEQAQTTASRKGITGVLETPLPYPSLRVGKEAASTLASGESAVSKVFYVSRSQLLERLSSAGSPADRFEHPLPCARSEVGWHAGALDGEAHYADSGDQIVDRPAQTPEDFPHSWEPIAVLQFEALLATPVGENLALARDVLCLTPRVRSLSLTGNFDLCLTSELLTWQAHCLQAVTLGPCQTDWDKTLALSHPAIRTTKSLRVCQGLLPREEFGWISGSSDALPQLEEFHWIMSFKYCWGDNQPVIRAINHLLGPPLSTTTATAAIDGEPQSRKRGRDCEKSERSASEDGCQQGRASKVTTSRRSTYLEARLDPADLAGVLEAAPSEQVRTAWSTGMAVPDQRHRLRVIPNGYREREDGGEEWVWREIQQDLYEEGRRWWERG